MHSSQTSYRLFLVEDDPELAEMIKDYLSKNRFDVTVINNGQEAAQEIPKQNPDIVLLDIMLPGMFGMDVCRTVREQYHGPIIMLTALDEDMDQMLGLELGADDYIIKPVHPRLLLTRIRTLLRRIGNAPLSMSGASERSSLTLGPLTINLAFRSVVVANQSIELTTAEFELLLLLAQEQGKVVDRNSIIKQLRGFDYDGLDRSIDRRISRLRKKLQTDELKQELIKTVRGQGYQLCINPV